MLSLVGVSDPFMSNGYPSGTTDEDESPQNTKTKSSPSPRGEDKAEMDAARGEEMRPPISSDELAQYECLKYEPCPLFHGKDERND